VSVGESLDLSLPSFPAPPGRDRGLVGVDAEANAHIAGDSDNDSNEEESFVETGAQDQDEDADEGEDQNEDEADDEESGTTVHRTRPSHQSAARPALCHSLCVCAGVCVYVCVGCCTDEGEDEGEDEGSDEGEEEGSADGYVTPAYSFAAMGGSVSPVVGAGAGAAAPAIAPYRPLDQAFASDMAAAHAMRFRQQIAARGMGFDQQATGILPPNVPATLARAAHAGEVSGDALFDPIHSAQNSFPGAQRTITAHSSHTLTHALSLPHSTDSSAVLLLLMCVQLSSH
jgi:hypothetical protein